MFSKYEVYTTTQSIYCYRDSNVLKNKLNIMDFDRLKEAENEITAIKLLDLLQNPIKGRFTKTHLLNIHRFIFEDIYSFAGRIRREQISKGNTMFYPPQLINRELNRVFDGIRKDVVQSNMDEDLFFDRLAYIMAELNIIHPFREGNGRAIREFIRVMARRNGYRLNWGNVDNYRILDTSIKSVDDYRVLISMLKECIEKGEQP